MNVEQLLSGKGHDVISVQPHRTLAEAIRTLSEKRIGAVVVMGADGALVGILSERDIIRALGELGLRCHGGPLRFCRRDCPGGYGDDDC